MNEAAGYNVLWFIAGMSFVVVFVAFLARLDKPHAESPCPWRWCGYDLGLAGLHSDDGVPVPETCPACENRVLKYGNEWRRVESTGGGES